MLLPLIVLLLLRFAGVKFAHEYIVLMDRAHKLHLDNVMVCGGNDVQSCCRCLFLIIALLAIAIFIKILAAIKYVVFCLSPHHLHSAIM